MKVSFTNFSKRVRFAVFACLYNILFQQGIAQISTFQKIYPTQNLIDQSARDILVTNDGGYLILGNTETGNENDLDIYLIKTDKMGELLWTKKYGGISPEYGFSIIPTLDSNYFIIGYSLSFSGGDYDTWLLKIDSVGTLIWSKVYGGFGYDEGHGIVETDDGHYVIVGTSNSEDYPNLDAYLMKIDVDGNVKWTKYYGGTDTEFGNSILKSKDGGFVFLGTTFSFGAGGGDAYLVKTNSDGTVLWTKTFGGTHNEEGKFIVEGSDGSLAFCIRDSSSGAGNIDIEVIKTDSAGNMIWDKTFGGTSKDTPKMIQNTSDGGYIVSGHSRSFGSADPDMWLIKLDSSGTKDWSDHYGGSANEHCYAAYQTADGGFIAVGHTRSYGPSYYEAQIMLLKLDSTGFVSVPKYSSSKNLHVYPNPTEGLISFSLEQKDSPVLVQIKNVLGQTIYDRTFASLINNENSIDLSAFKAGFYFISFESDQRKFSEKIVLK